MLKLSDWSKLPSGNN